MSDLLSHTALICSLILVLELLSHLAPKDKTLSFTQALIFLLLLASAVSQLLSVSWPDPLASVSPVENTRLEAYVNDQAAAAAQEQAVQYLEGLFASAGLEPKKILVNVDIGADFSIELTKAQAWFRFESDAQRARALLRGALGPDVQVEVTADGT